MTATNAQGGTEDDAVSSGPPPLEFAPSSHTLGRKPSVYEGFTDA